LNINILTNDFDVIYFKVIGFFIGIKPLLYDVLLTML